MIARCDQEYRVDAAAHEDVTAEDRIFKGIAGRLFEDDLSGGRVSRSRTIQVTFPDCRVDSHKNKKFGTVTPEKTNPLFYPTLATGQYDYCICLQRILAIRKGFVGEIDKKHRYYNQSYDT